MEARIEQDLLQALVDVNGALVTSRDVRAGVQASLLTLERRLGAVGVALALAADGEGETRVTHAAGVLHATVNRRVTPMEGVLGRVLAQGKPIVVSRTSIEPMVQSWEGRDGLGVERSLLAVPLPGERGPSDRAPGALLVLVPYDEARPLHEVSRALRVAAALLAQAVRIHELAEAERERAQTQNGADHGAPDEERFDYSNLIGKSAPMRLVYDQVSQVARTSTTVLIRGESGTGKELVAHAIHHNSPRAKHPFVRVNCGALPESLIESELFGHEKGAFTGAAARKKGRFELAEGGTLFLDEIGELSAATQVKLLRALQEREFERVGGTETVKANVRVIAATNKNIEEAIGQGTFREDLYYRLNVFTVTVPPLRERRTDILLLVDHFVHKFSKQHGRSIRRVAAPAMEMLVAYAWPGNVRELENTMERAVLLCEGPVLQPEHLPPTLAPQRTLGGYGALSLSDAVEKLERDLIEDALRTARGNRAKAARMLSTTERILSYKVGKYGIDCSRYRS